PSPRHPARRPPPRPLRGLAAVPARRRPPGRERERGDPREPPRGGKPGSDPPESVHAVPLRPLDCGASLECREARPASDRTGRGTPDRVGDGTTPRAVPGHPAVVVRLGRPAFRIDDRGVWGPIHYGYTDAWPMDTY